MISTAALVWLCGCSNTPGNGRLQGSEQRDTAQQGIETAIRDWNVATNSGDVAVVMERFDQSDTIMLVGSDRGEAFKGRQQIEGWLTKLFKNNRFSWDFERIEIDPFETDAAWVFLEGKMRLSDLSGNIKGETPYRITGTLIKRGSQWKWRIWSGSIPGSE